MWHKEDNYGDVIDDWYDEDDRYDINDVSSSSNRNKCRKNSNSKKVKGKAKAVTGVFFESSRRKTNGVCK